jgi:uncharacterized phage-associated protein
MLIDHSREKLFNLIAYFVKNTKNCKKTKLFKLLYYADFWHFKETGKSITDLKYYAWEMGPVPTALYEEIEHPKQDFTDYLSVIPGEDIGVEIKAKKPVDMQHFTKREMRIIEEVAYIFKDATAKDMIECTHVPKNPWCTTLEKKGKFKEIDYTLALDDSKESITLEEYKQRKEDFESIKKALS